MAEDKDTTSEEPIGNTAADEGDDKGVKDQGVKPPFQAIAVSTGVIAAAAAPAAIKYLAD